MSDEHNEIRNARLSALEAHDQLAELEARVGPMADQLSAITALLTGGCRGRVQTSPDGKTTFNVYLPGRCASESFAFPTLEEIVHLIQERQTLMDNMAEAEAILQRHGKSASLARPERPTSRPRYSLVENVPEDED